MDKQAKWQLTATTINCDAVDDEVTILVNKDWSLRCTGHTKYLTAREANKLRKKGHRLGRELKCEGPECPRALQYREKLIAEESKEEKVAQVNG